MVRHAPRPDAIESGGAVRTGERDDRLDGEGEGESSQGDLQRGVSRIVAEQPVGPQVSALVHRTPGRESGAPAASPPQILNRAVRPGAIHHPVRPPGCAGFGHPHSAS